jgi:hypothetical protein
MQSGFGKGIRRMQSDGTAKAKSKQEIINLFMPYLLSSRV